MSSKRYLSAKEAANLLEVSRQTLYAYVSRGLIRSEQTAGGKRQKRYYAEDVEKLLARKAGRHNPETLAQDALYWGTPVMDSAITLIDDGKLYYRGRAIADLVQTASIEQVAALIWTGEMSQSTTLFNLDVQISAQTYETMLLSMQMNGATLTPIQELMSFLPMAAADDISAFDLRPESVALTGARIMRLTASVMAGNVPENIALAAMLQQGLCPQDDNAEALFNAAMIVTADHELNASSFSARVVASAGATPYAAVIAGLATLQGIKHGGYTERVSALLNEAQTLEQIRPVMTARLRRGEQLPGFGHKLYPDGDPRAQILLKLLAQHYGDTAEFALIQSAIDTAATLISEKPTVDTLLVGIERILHLPPGSALSLFALGRTIGWIGQAIEQYQTNRLIRPRARYTGVHPNDQ